MITDPLETDRLWVRPFQPGDVEAVSKYLSDPVVMEWLPEDVLTAAQVQAFVDENVAVGETRTAYAVSRKVEGDLIGHVIFHPWFAPRTFEIGWVFDRAHHGNGYGTEAARVVLDYGFANLELHRIIATCQPQNPASFRIMEKLGMRREGFFQKCIYRGGNLWWDEYFYAILEEEWADQRRASSA